VGRFSGSIESSFSSGPVTSAFVGGGLVGWTDSTVTNSYSLGSIVGPYAAGGLIGITIDAADVKNSYAIGTVTGGGPPGGLIGREVDSSSQTFTYWDADTSGVTDLSQGVGNIPNAPGVTGLTDKQLKSGLPSGFDPAIWAINEKINSGYPYLIANPPQ
jgi:hypothetical protein